MLLPNVLPPLLIRRQAFPPLLVPLQCCRCLFQCNVTAASSNFCRSWFQCAAAAAFKLLPRRCYFHCIDTAAASNVSPLLLLPPTASSPLLLPTIYCCRPQCIAVAAASNVPSPPLLLPMCYLHSCFQCIATRDLPPRLLPVCCHECCFRCRVTAAGLPGKDIRCGRQSSGRNRLTLP
eukprot:770592_1